MPLHIVDHPLAGHLLAELRDKRTKPERFRVLARNLTTLLVIEATRSMLTVDESVETPIGETSARRLGQKLAVIPILRAGLGMLEPIVELFPDVEVGYIGLERNEETAIARSYYNKVPKLAGRLTLCVDPMLATGGSAAQAIHFIKGKGAGPVKMICVVAAPEGVQVLQSAHPDVEIYTASLDDSLNAQKYIVPGLGDFGDRLYGT
jgi:uracil phosphoribosyltransferase